MSERTAEQERLRFEGDLDKWMHILGSGVSGYQPEAYAFMDAACAELVRRRSEAGRFMETLEEFVEFVEASDNREGYCMCGDPMDAHGFHSNHSPVDMGTYRADGLIEKAKALIGKDVFG